jgi:hypothetical protein
MSEAKTVVFEFGPESKALIEKLIASRATPAARPSGGSGGASACGLNGPLRPMPSAQPPLSWR